SARQAYRSPGERHLKAVKLGGESAATPHLMRWVSLHPTNIAQKVQIIVEHYRTNVRHLLDGHAKAMVVTSSREHAIRYKDAIDAYIKKSGYTDVATLVAFSGTMTAEQVPGVTFAGVEPPYSETNLNKGLRGRTIPTALGSNYFQLLIVANKYQTGFDQPLLCAMYVDKRLDGVSAVQTLSRLNRTYAVGGKDTTYILGSGGRHRARRGRSHPHTGPREHAQAVPGITGSVGCRHRRCVAEPGDQQSAGRAPLRTRGAPRTARAVAGV